MGSRHGIRAFDCLIGYEAFVSIERDSRALGQKLTREDRELMLPSIIEAVAEKIGHEPSVCKASYRDPAVVTLFVEGKVK